MQRRGGVSAGREAPHAIGHGALPAGRVPAAGVVAHELDGLGRFGVEGDAVFQGSEGAVLVLRRGDEERDAGGGIACECEDVVFEDGACASWLGGREDRHQGHAGERAAVRGEGRVGDAVDGCVAGGVLGFDGDVAVALDEADEVVGYAD